VDLIYTAVVYIGTKNLVKVLMEKGLTWCVEISMNLE